MGYILFALIIHYALYAIALLNDERFKHFQKIYLNVDPRLVFEGAGGDWSHDSSLGCRNPPGSTE